MSESCNDRSGCDFILMIDKDSDPVHSEIFTDMTLFREDQHLNIGHI